MKNGPLTLRDVAGILGVRPHRVVYAITSGRVPEPLRISGRRMFAKEDVENLRRHFEDERQRRGKGRPNGNR